jgi:hypothetical protein
MPAGHEIDLRATPLDATGGGAAFDDNLTSFSVAKSFVSTLVGIAIDEGPIGSVEDPVTEYLPTLTARDPRFERITLRDLLTMSSGIRYWETDLPWPWADDTFTYYGGDRREQPLAARRWCDPSPSGDLGGRRPRAIRSRMGRSGGSDPHHTGGVATRSSEDDGATQPPCGCGWASDCRSS